MFDKYKTKLRSVPYLDFIRSKPCLICGTTIGVQAHHEDKGILSSGMGTKAHDSQTVPLCPGERCHADAENPGFWERNNIDPKVKMIEYMTEFLFKIQEDKREGRKVKI